MNVSRASRAPSVGDGPIGLAMISPASRNTSAHATAQTSARVTEITVDASSANLRTAAW